MKTKMTIIALFFFAANSFGQMVSYLSNLQTSETGITVAEISLIHRSRSNYKDIAELGTKFIMIPNFPNGNKLKIEYNRFRTQESDPFELEGMTYVPVNLFYDNESSDPRDDIYLLTIPFQVKKELIQKELEFYEGEKLLTANFEIAPQGMSPSKTRH